MLTTKFISHNHFIISKYMNSDFKYKLIVPRRYIKAYVNVKVVNEVLQAFRDKKLTLRAISDKSGVNYETIRNWYRNFKKDNNYVPGKKIGQHKRIFPPEVEENIADMIKIQFIHHHVMIKRKYLRLILYNAWQSLDPDNRSRLIDDRFISSKFIKLFCKRHRLSFRTMRKKKRSEINKKEVKNYSKEIYDALLNYKKELIFNMDETAWNFVYKRGEVLAEVGNEEVDAQLPDDIKKCFTVISTISASGDKYPPIFLATGTTNRCEKQFEGMQSDDNQYYINHGKAGKTTDEVMKFYLKIIHKKWAKKQKCVLVLDQYPSHISDSTKMAAIRYKIKLIFIPVSATDKYQPLDKYIFGIMKSQASSYFDEKAFQYQDAMTKPEAADLFIKLWNGLQMKHILKAWDCSYPKNEEEEENGDHGERKNEEEDEEEEDEEEDEEDNETENDEDDYFIEYETDIESEEMEDKIDDKDDLYNIKTKKLKRKYKEIESETSTYEDDSYSNYEEDDDNSYTSSETDDEPYAPNKQSPKKTSNKRKHIKRRHHKYAKRRH